MGDGVSRGEGSPRRHARRDSDPVAAGSPHLINSKLEPPQSAATCVSRHALLQQLDEASQRTLVLLSAPTGSGKSTLLSHWHRERRNDRASAWLSLDEQDNEPVRFFTYLHASLRRALSGFDAYIASRSDQDAGPFIDSIAAVFIEQLGRIDRELTIVLDDCQWLTSAFLTRAIDFMLRRSPSNVRWVLSGRCMPAVNLSALRLNDELIVFSATELRFDRDLILQLSRKLSRRELSAEEADYILDRTEGWVAGVKLALLAREESRTPGNVVEAFAGSHAEVASYFAGSVLEEQTDEMRAFLLASCIVDRMTGELCDAMLNIDDSQRILENLERAQLFIQPLDGHRHWFRYHTLFRDFLRSRLRRDAAAQLATLHERASRWYAEHQFFEEALTHALAAKNVCWRNQLLARCTAAWLQGGEISEVLHWSEKLPLADVLADFSMARHYIVALVLRRRFPEAANALRTLRQTDVTATAAQLAALETLYSVLADSDDSHTLDEASLQDDGIDRFLAGTLLTLQAYALLRRYQFDLSRRTALRAREMLEQHSVYGRGYADSGAARADRAQGDLKRASERCESTFAEVRNGRRGPAWVNAATSIAYTRYEENRLPEAEALCIEILPLLSVASTIESFTTAYTTFARIKAADGRIEEAEQLLEHLHGVLEGGAHRRFVAQVVAEKLLLCLRQRDTGRAVKLARDAQLEQRFESGEFRLPRRYDEAWERSGSAYAQLLLHTQRHAEAREVLANLRSSASDAGYVYRQIRLEAALSCCLAGTGELDAASAALNAALALTRGYGFTRGVFDEVPMLSALVRQALEHHTLRHTLPFHYFRKFDNLFAVRPPARSTARVAKMAAALPLEPLTDREIEILRLLARGLSNTEISERSQIALSTAKWHLKNIFAKLDVSTRTGALARARELRLVD